MLLSITQATQGGVQLTLFKGNLYKHELQHEPYEHELQYLQV